MSSSFSSKIINKISKLKWSLTFIKFLFIEPTESFSLSSYPLMTISWSVVSRNSFNFNRMFVFCMGVKNAGILLRQNFYFTPGLCILANLNAVRFIVISSLFVVFRTSAVNIDGIFINRSRKFLEIRAKFVSLLYSSKV
jgi:hypothetical protein